MKPSRRQFLGTTAAAGASLGLGDWAALLPISPANADDAKVTPDLVRTDQDIQRLSPTQAAELEKNVQEVYAKVAPAVVRIYSAGAEVSFSGVIISPTGDVLTCAHHNLPPKAKVTVELADGERVKATMLGIVKEPANAGRYRATDVGMLRLDDRRKWPVARLGRSADLMRGDLCLEISSPGFHKSGQPPLLRLGRVLQSHPVLIEDVRTSCRGAVGDSGGPLFDLDGRVVGVHKGSDYGKSPNSRHSRVEDFLTIRNRLRSGEEVTAEKDKPKKRPEKLVDQWGAFEPTEELAKAVGAAHRSVVELLRDGKPVALGLVVGADGWVVTKRTELSGPSGPCEIACRLADGRQLAARIVGGSSGYDLALLKMDPAGLPAVVWGKEEGPRVGQIVASLGPNPRPIHFATIGATRVLNPAKSGNLPVSGKPVPEGTAGIVFEEFWKSVEADEVRELFKPGDLITHLDDVPTPTADEFVKVRERRLAGSDGFIGERVKVTARRGDQTVLVYVPLVPNDHTANTYWRLGPRWSQRRDGFPTVFSHDGGIPYDRCGGPVVDREGRVIGVNIARADSVQTFAIPADVVERLVISLLGAERK
jgi:serine protease Do